MITALLIALQLVQANDFVRFEICYLDPQAYPWEFRPHPEGLWANVRKSRVEGYTDARLGVGGPVRGIYCTRVYTQAGTFFVVGSVREICLKLGGRSC